jgi:hypothetical protein
MSRNHFVNWLRTTKLGKLTSFVILAVGVA